ncbi:TerB family tellurite resistance protein [Porticoccaceae bacterium LTM1]|nr:TerB family tellurite resistance protein [Porticoccaceae bacterium LTM1]
MIARLKAFFQQNIDLSDEKSTVRSVQLAAAALLVEVMVTDNKVETSEEQRVKNLLQTQYELSSDEVETLFELAHQEVKDATSLYQFTRLINENFEYQEKITLIENLWKVAFADNVLDKHEEAVIRRISELIYVSHSDFIRAKLNTR